MVQEVTIKFSLPSVERLKKFEKYLAPLGVFLIALAVYVKTLAPSIVFGDAGELIVAANGLGIAHPPGFPIWCIFTKLFTLLPIGNIAWRANLATACYGAAASVLTFILIKEVLLVVAPRAKSTIVTTIAFFLSLSLAFTRNLWSESVSAEVYTLDLLFSVGNILTLFYWYKTRDRRYLVFLSLLMGLSLTNHYLVGALYPAFAVFILLIDWKIIKNFKLLGCVLLAFILGLSVYLYLPLRSRANPVIDWGKTSTWQGFLNHVTRKQYGVFDANYGIYIPTAQFSSIKGGFSRVFKILWYVGEIVGRELLPLAAFSLLGLLYLFRKERKLLLLIGLLTFFRAYLYLYLVMVDKPAQRGSSADLMVLFAIGVILAAVGVYGCWEKLERFGRPRTALLVFCGTLPLFFVIKNYSVCNLSDNRIALDHAWNVLNTVEEGATLLAAEDSFFPVLYLLKAEGQRSDIIFFDRAGRIFPYTYDFSESMPDPGSPAHREVLSEMERTAVEEAPAGVYHAAFAACNDNPRRGILVVLKKPPSPGPQLNMARDYANILELTSEEVGSRAIDQLMAISYHLSLGCEHYRRGYKDMGREEFQVAQDLSSGNFGGFDTIAHRWLAVGEGDRGLAVLEEAVKLRPNHPEIQYSLGLLNAEVGNFEAAAAAFEWVVASGSYTSSPVGKELGRVYLELGRWEEALGVLRAVEKADPLERDAKFLYGLGVASYNVGQPRESLGYFERVLELDPDHIGALGGQGLCYWSLKDYAKTREVFEEVRRIDPHSEIAAEILEKVGSGGGSL